MMIVPDPEHSVAASLELIGDGPDLGPPSSLGEIAPQRLDVWGWSPLQGQQREKANLLRHPQQFLDGCSVKLEAQLVRVEEEQVRAQSQVELAVREREARQRRRDVAAF